MSIGVINENLPDSGYPVEVLGQQSLAGEVDRIKSPCQQQFVWVIHSGFNFDETIDYLVDSGAARPQSTLRIGAIKETHIGHPPRPARHHMRMRLNEPRNDHLVGEAFVHYGRAPRLQFLNRADREHPTLPNRHRLCEGCASVHSQNSSCGVNHRVVHRADGTPPLVRSRTIAGFVSAWDDIFEEMTDILIRDVPDEVVASLDAKAKSNGLTRAEYLRRLLAEQQEPALTREQLDRFAARTADLSNPDVMAAAWR